LLYDASRRSSGSSTRPVDRVCGNASSEGAKLENRPAHHETVDVLQVIPYMHPSAGGPPIVVDRFSRQLTECGRTNRVATTDVCARGADPRWTESSASSYAMDVFPSVGPGTFSYSRPFAQNIDRLVAQSRVVHLHAVWTYLTWATLRACRRQNVPCVVMPHGMLDPNSLSRKWLKKQLYGRWVEWPTLRRTDGMIYTNQVEKSVTEGSISRLPRGYVVPLGSDEPPDADRSILAAEFLADYPQLQAKELVVFLSRLHSKKGLDLLIPGFAQVAQGNSRAHLVIVGAAEPEYQKRLDEMVEQSHAAHCVTFTGPLSGRKKWSALAAAQVFALPSYQEAFPLAVIEAMRMGLPVVITQKVNICGDIMQAGGGVECELSPQSVAQALEELLSDPQKIAAIGGRAQQLARHRYTWKRSVELLCQVYDEILQR
jgi:glycosyltransferase involved in cell wall biosynthesis